jgi:hypothetical protein
MALPPWAPVVLQAQATHTQWQDPPMPCQVHATGMCGVPLWHHDQGFMAWRRRETSSNHQVFVLTKVGYCVSVDQKFISTQVGCIAQLKGSLTKKRYTLAMVFIYHYSKLKYIHLMTRLTSEETIDAMRVFEHFAKQHGIRILLYRNNALKKNCNAKEQYLTLFGINAHFAEWICQESYLKSLQKCKETTPPCATAMASCHPLGPLAICLKECSLPLQHLTCPQRFYSIKARALQLDQSRQKDESPARFWLPSVCFGE